MVVYGGMNDFGKILGDMIVYDLEKDKWLENVRIKKGKMPSMSHGATCTVFYEQRQSQYIKNLYYIPPVEWNHIDRFLLEEGFYLFGGLQDGADPSNDLWIMNTD